MAETRLDLNSMSGESKGKQTMWEVPVVCRRGRAMQC